MNKLDVFLRPKLVYSNDMGEIHDLIRANNVELVIGSSLEAKVAKDLQIPLLQAAFPLTDKVILSKTYAGYRGGVTLLEDLGNEIVAGVRAGKS